MNLAYKVIPSIILSVLLLSCLPRVAQAQFDTVYVGITGMTCSQCSRTVELSLRKLSFVADVQMDLANTNAKVVLSASRKADMEQVAKAVTDAGFSVGALVAGFTFGSGSVLSGALLTYKGDRYLFTDAPAAPLQGHARLRFIGKRFMSRQDTKKYPLPAGKSPKGPGNLYHVAIED